MENLDGDYFVPGNELDTGDGIWKEIQAWVAYCFKTFCLLQTVTDDAVMLWAERACNDYDKKVSKNAPAKQKAGFIDHID